MDTTGGGNTAFGWISMNSLDPVSSVDYGVNIPSNNGPLSGYAWSENYGWISFNPADVAGCPAGSCSAQRVGNTVTGWARVLSIRDAGGNSGGWTGFISLDAYTIGSAIPYGVTIAGNVLSGYAYSDELGWIDWSGATINPPKSLQLCQNSCTSTFYRNGGSVSLYDTDLPQNYVACYGDASKLCADPAATNVTALSVWTETNAPTDAIALSGVNPKVVSPKPVASGTKSESINVSYNTENASFTVNVTKFCASHCASEAINHCQGETFTTLNSCSVSETCTNAGTRYCDFNWKEVAP